MAKQIHKQFSTSQVVELLQRYIDKKIERHYIQEILGIKKAMFFRILQKFRNNPENFSIDYLRTASKRITPELEKNIIKELQIDQRIIKDKNNPMKTYNYSYVQDRLEDKYNQKVSLPTIIDRAKKNDFYLKKKAKKKLMTARS